MVKKLVLAMLIGSIAWVLMGDWMKELVKYPGIVAERGSPAKKIVYRSLF